VTNACASESSCISDIGISRQSLFYFISFTTLCSPLTDIVIVHIVYINESNPFDYGFVGGYHVLKVWADGRAEEWVGGV
jgi:hypothetical protein